MDILPSKDTTERTEALHRVLASAARTVAFKLRLPWKVGELYEAAEQGAVAAWNEWPDSTLGLPRERFLGARIDQAVQRAGESMQAQLVVDGETRPPTEQEIETALKAFSAEQWKILIESMDQVEVEMFRRYQRQNTDELKQRFGARKVERIEAYTIMRSTELWRSSDSPKNLVAVSDAYWAVFWKEQARFLNTQGKGRTSTGRSLDEATSDRNTAKRLSKRDEFADHDMPVSPYKVKQWRKHWKELPFEDFDGDFLSYLTTIYYKKEYDGYRRSKGNENQ